MDDLVDQLHDPNSVQYHRWLTVDQIAAHYGPAEADIRTVAGWLAAHGFAVNAVHRANAVIDFSGSARAIRDAFHTQIHNLELGGRSHMANASDPKIPAALATLVNGVVSLHNFRPHPMSRPRPEYTFPCAAAIGCINPGQTTWYVVVPDDLYTIYNMNRVFDDGITGKGQTIVVVEDSNIYTAADWQTFRSTFGLSQRYPYGSLTQIHPQSVDGGACADPGTNIDDFEAELDVQWASAAAPNAAIVVATCAGTDTNFNAGFLTALQNLLTGSSPAPAIVSVSYGTGESEAGASFNAYVRSLYELAALQGISVFVGSGDGGADGDAADQFATAAVHGINASGLASTPFNVAVGGTDFADTLLNENATYWNSTNGLYWNSARSYVPETPWNDSCANQLRVSFFGYATAYGANGFCNTPLGESFYGVEAGSGAPSACGAPSIPGVVSGSCRGYRKPLYQMLAPGNPHDGVRGTPDISLFAAAGTWWHYYVVCYSDPTPGFLGLPCVGPPANWGGGGGTSFASPIMAGVQALINQATGNRQGNPNYVLYALAALQYNSPGGTADCNSTLGNQIDRRCIFHDITIGDNNVNCVPLTDSSGNTVGTFNCYLPGGSNGVLSLSNTSYEPAYPATQGWDFATGIGSPDVYNLIRAWPGSRLH